jgi:hypothetical protein
MNGFAQTEIDIGVRSAFGPSVPSSEPQILRNNQIKPVSSDQMKAFNPVNSFRSHQTVESVQPVPLHSIVHDVRRRMLFSQGAQSIRQRDGELLICFVSPLHRMIGEVFIFAFGLFPEIVLDGRWSDCAPIMAARPSLAYSCDSGSPTAD